MFLDRYSIHQPLASPDHEAKVEEEVSFDTTSLILYACMLPLPLIHDCLWYILQIPRKEKKIQAALSPFLHRYGFDPKKAFLFNKSHQKESYISLLESCRNLRDVIKGENLHSEISRENSSLLQDVVIANMLVGMYANCGYLERAENVFENLTLRDVIIWTTFMGALSTHGFCKKTLYCFDHMQIEGISPDSVTFVCIVKACANIGDIEKGQSMYSEIVKKGFDEDVVVATSLVDMYAKCSLLTTANEVFCRILTRNIVSWNALMAGHVEKGNSEETLLCFRYMQEEDLAPNDVSYVCALKSCCIMKDMDFGRGLHLEIVKKGLEREIFVHNTLIDMYAKFGLFVDAIGVFDKLPLVRDEISWNALLSGYVEHGHSKQALDCFEEMRREGFSSPHLLMYVCSMKACANIGEIERGKQLHSEITKKGWGEDVTVCNTLIDTYAEYNLLIEAQFLFDTLIIKTPVSWNSLIAGYVKNGYNEKALDLFYDMAMVADSTTIVCTLKACGSEGFIYKGLDIHIRLVKQGIDKGIFVGNTLVDTYAKCGMLAEAQEVFKTILSPDVISWNALITGYAQIGEYGQVFIAVGRMLEGNARPDSLTFVSILNACCHAGLSIDHGLLCFVAMREQYDIVPTVEHHSCMVNLLSRAGHIDKAIRFIEDMPCHPGMVVWNTMLGACRKWGSFDTGMEIFQHVIQLDRNDDAAYFLILNIYADEILRKQKMMCSIIS